MSAPIKQLPPVVPLAIAAREILSIDRHEAYRLVKDGKLGGAFKVGKYWYVNVRRMISEMQTAQ